MLAPCAIAPRIAFKVSAAISGVSPKITSMSSAPCSIAARAASTACAVPRRSACTNTSAFGQRTRLPLGNRIAFGPTTTASGRCRRRAPRQHMRQQRAPAIACSTFGRAERMRVPRRRQARSPGRSFSSATLNSDGRMAPSYWGMAPGERWKAGTGRTHYGGNRWILLPFFTV
jgi:hypothetical protein